MARRARVAVVVVVAVLCLVAFAALATPARGAQDSDGFPSITFEYYTYGGQEVQLGCGGTDCGSIPVGATVDIRVWVDLYNCDPVTIYYGASGAGSDTVDFNGAFSMDFQHTYDAAGIYPVEAVMPTCPGTYTDVAPLTIGGSSSSGGGGGGGFGTSGPYNDTALFPMAMFGFLFGILALALGASAGAVGATAGASGARGGRISKGGAPPPGPPAGYIPFTQPHLEGTPYSMSTHWVSLLDIPIGAQRVDPGRIPFRPGTPTDVFQAPMCPDGCGELVYTAAGWFCRNPECPGLNRGATLTDFPKVGEFYG